MIKLKEFENENVKAYWVKYVESEKCKRGVTMDELRVYENPITFNSYAQDERKVLSNFYTCALKYDGTNFNSLEQMYYYLQAGNSELKRLILNQTRANDVKVLAKQVKIESNNRISIMRKCLQVKFNQCKEFREYLLSTGENDLVENAWWGDMYWGCVQWGCKKLGETYIGVNALGRLLMELREKNKKT